MGLPDDVAAQLRRVMELSDAERARVLEYLCGLAPFEVSEALDAVVHVGERAVAPEQTPADWSDDPLPF